MVQPFLIAESVWIEVKDGNDSARELFEKHYSRYHYADGRKPKLFIGPGEKMVLLTPCARAVFAFRKFRSADDQPGVNNCIFHNEGAGVASELITEAMRLAWERWPGERLYTYVNPRAIRSTNPGYCYLRAGWRKAGITKKRNRKAKKTRLRAFNDSGKSQTGTRSKRKMTSEEPSDFICANCGFVGKVSELMKGYRPGKHHTVSCPCCGLSHLHIEFTIPETHEPSAKQSTGDRPES